MDSQQQAENAKWKKNFNRFLNNPDRNIAKNWFRAFLDCFNQLQHRDFDFELTDEFSKELVGWIGKIKVNEWFPEWFSDKNGFPGILKTADEAPSSTERTQINGKKYFANEPKCFLEGMSEAVIEVSRGLEELGSFAAIFWPYDGAQPINVSAKLLSESRVRMLLGMQGHLASHGMAHRIQELVTQAPCPYAGSGASDQRLCLLRTGFSTLTDFLAGLGPDAPPLREGEARLVFDGKVVALLPAHGTADGGSGRRHWALVESSPGFRDVAIPPRALGVCKALKEGDRVSLAATCCVSSRKAPKEWGVVPFLASRLLSVNDPEEDSAALRKQEITRAGMVLLVKDLLKIVDRLNRAGVIHRNLRPSSLMVNSDYQASA